MICIYVAMYSFVKLLKNKVKLKSNMVSGLYPGQLSVELKCVLFALPNDVKGQGHTLVSE